MSSPKRAAKAVLKPASKTATRRAVKSTSSGARTTAKPDVNIVGGASAEAAHLAAALERSIVDGKLDLVSAEALQKLIGAACRLYTARAQSGEDLLPVANNSISATDVMVTASGLLRAANLAVFELGMWQSWTGR